MLQIHSFTFNALQENTYVVYDDTGECVIIDPGCYDKAEENELSGFIRTNKLTVKLLLNTHGHVDHVLGNYFVKETYRVPLLIHPNEVPILRAAVAYAPMYGFTRYAATEPDQLITERDTIPVGDATLRILFVPGHAPGHIAFYHAEQQFCIGGDVLFRNSIGRTDLPGGDYDTLIHSIRTQLFTLPDDVTVYPGHGGETTIGYEKKYNPFVSGQ